MGYGLRYYLAEDDTTLKRVSAARYRRWLAQRERLPPDRAGRELALLEVIAEVDRQRVLGVVRLLPVRHFVRADGRLDLIAATRLALKRVDLLERLGERDPEAQIAELEADANYLWWPTDAHLEALGAALFRRPPRSWEFLELRSRVFSPGA
jgi:hypothetical protein